MFRGIHIVRFHARARKSEVLWLNSLPAMWWVGCMCWKRWWGEVCRDLAPLMKAEPSVGFPHCLADQSCQCRKLRRRGLDPWVRKVPWRMKWQLTPIFLPRKFHGQRSLVGYSSWSLRESDMTERLSVHAGIIDAPCGGFTPGTFLPLCPAHLFHDSSSVLAVQG